MFVAFKGCNLLVINHFIQFISRYNYTRKFSSNSSDRPINYYLAGLIEGDGHFNVPKSLKSISGKNTYAGIEVVFALKDLPSAEFLKNMIGGNIYIRLDKNAVRWVIQDKKTITYLVNCINGKLRTPKINYFYNLIDYLNAKGDNIIKLCPRWRK